MENLLLLLSLLISIKLGFYPDFAENVRKLRINATTLLNWNWLS
jgi:hypothetical protein